MIDVRQQRIANCRDNTSSKNKLLKFLSRLIENGFSGSSVIYKKQSRYRPGVAQRVPGS
jgi:hypothetical protein